MNTAGKKCTKRNIRYPQAERPAGKGLLSILLISFPFYNMTAAPLNHLSQLPAGTTHSHWCLFEGNEVYLVFSFLSLVIKIPGI
jgi:hypothetical protein